MKRILTGMLATLLVCSSNGCDTRTIRHDGLLSTTVVSSETTITTATRTSPIRTPATTTSGKTTTTVSTTTVTTQKKATMPSTSLPTMKQHVGEVNTERESQEGTHQITGVPLILQMPELPTGCEVTALTMMLHYYGFSVSKTTMASTYLPTVAFETTVGEDGKTYGPDMNRYFVGDPFSYWGFICGTKAIVRAANRYLTKMGSDLQAVSFTGISLEELYSRIDNNQPVLVWVTVDMKDRDKTQGWYTDKGEWISWSEDDHGAVLTGYTAETVTLCDPISGNIRYNRKQFEKVFASRGNQCVVLE